MSKLITAIFKKNVHAIAAAQELVQRGFPQDDISVLMSETTRGQDFSVNEATKAPEGMSAGAAVGGALGTIAAGLTTVGLVAAPGLGIFAVGAWLSMLAGFGAGALSGGLIGGLIGLGIPEREAEAYNAEIQNGGILLGLTVYDDSLANEAKKVFEANDAHQLKIEAISDDRYAKLRKTA
jgi:hypothetical protein